MLTSNVTRTVAANVGRMEARAGKTIAKESAEALGRVTKDAFKLDNVAYVKLYKDAMAKAPKGFEKQLEGKWTGEKLMMAIDAHAKGLTAEANTSLFHAAYYGLDKHHSSLVKSVADELGYKEASAFAVHSFRRNPARDPKWLPKLAEHTGIEDKVRFFNKMEQRTAHREGTKTIIQNILHLPVSLPFIFKYGRSFT